MSRVYLPRTPLQRLCAYKTASSPLGNLQTDAAGPWYESPDKARQRRLAEILLRHKATSSGDGLTNTPLPR